MVVCRFYSSGTILLVLWKTLTELLLIKGRIRVSNKSPVAARIVFAVKLGGVCGLRFGVDYQGLNTLTAKDRYLLPLIRENLDSLGKAKWPTKLDVSATLIKIQIIKGGDWKTACRTRYHLYKYLVTRFDLTGAPATF